MMGSDMKYAKFTAPARPLLVEAGSADVCGQF